MQRDRSARSHAARRHGRLDGARCTPAGARRSHDRRARAARCAHVAPRRARLLHALYGGHGVRRRRVCLPRGCVLSRLRERRSVRGRRLPRVWRRGRTLLRGPLQRRLPHLPPRHLRALRRDRRPVLQRELRRRSALRSGRVRGPRLRSARSALLRRCLPRRRGVRRWLAHHRRWRLHRVRRPRPAVLRRRHRVRGRASLLRRLHVPCLRGAVPALLRRRPLRRRGELRAVQQPLHLSAKARPPTRARLGYHRAR